MQPRDRLPRSLGLDAVVLDDPAALEQVLEALDPTRQVAEFVLTGQHVEALNKLSGGYRWRLQAGPWTSAAEKKAMTTLYAGFGEVDAAVLRRWGRVLDAAWGAHGWGLTLGDVAGCHWPELMLRQAAASHPSAPLPVTFADLERIAAADGSGAAPTTIILRTSNQQGI